LGTVAWPEAVFLIIGVALIPVVLAALMERLVRWINGSPLEGRSPFTVDLARAPGFSVQHRVDGLQSDLAAHVALAFIVPFSFLALWLARKHLAVDVADLHVALTLAFVGSVATVWFILQVLRLSLGLRRARLTLYGKMAAGQEIDQLMRTGARVFHDLPGDGFNIDHVIVAPAGVFCIETETRGKPQHGRSVEDATAIYDGHGLRFPDVTDDVPVRHARDRARWLANWIKRATGLVIPVQPAVALPRWVIDRQGSGDVVVMNPREASRLLGSPRLLETEQVDQIAFQLEKLGRGRLEPANYRATRKPPNQAGLPTPKRRRSRA
jgi:hypothetical protein